METKKQTEFWGNGNQRKGHSIAEVDGTYRYILPDGIDLGTIAYEGKSIRLCR